MKCHDEICMNWKADITELFVVCFLVRFVLAQQCNSLSYQNKTHFFKYRLHSQDVYPSYFSEISSPSFNKI